MRRTPDRSVVRQAAGIKLSLPTNSRSKPTRSGDPLVHRAARRRDRVLTRGRIRLDAILDSEAGEDPGRPHRPARFIDTRRSTDVLGRTSSGRSRRRPVGYRRLQDGRPVNIVELRVCDGLVTAIDPQERVDGRDQANPNLKIIGVTDRTLRPRQGQEGHDGLPRGAPRWTCSSRTMTTSGSAPIEAIEAARWPRARTSTSSTIDAVPDGMVALAPARSIHRRVAARSAARADRPGQEVRGGPRPCLHRMARSRPRSTSAQATKVLPRDDLIANGVPALPGCCRSTGRQAPATTAKRAERTR